jgi:hypothetical protein
MKNLYSLSMNQNCQTSLLTILRQYIQKRNYILLCENLKCMGWRKQTIIETEKFIADLKSKIKDIINIDLALTEQTSNQRIKPTMNDKIVTLTV